MHVFLDNRTLESGDFSTLNDAIDAAAREAERTGRLITEVMVDGRLLTEDELDFERSKQLPPAEVRLQTADPYAMLRQTFAEAADALAQADSLQRDAAVMIESDRQAEAMTELGAALEIWGSVHRAVTLGLEIGGLNLHEAIPGGTTPTETIQALERHLRTIRTALAAQDPVGLSDTLQYDLPDVVGAWREMLTHLQEQLAPRGGDDSETTGP